uniref:Uncharacterized protein n=1 Tax=Arundo donax TaxID=35708 RepID=A0A0A8YVB4_ARUDO
MPPLDVGIEDGISYKVLRVVP